VIVAILQARTGSTRLPGKVLLPILGEPMIARQIERLRRSRRIDRLLVATSNSAEDDPLAGLCARIGIPCYRGDLEDVLDRFYRAAIANGARHIVRLTGDCPLADPVEIDRLVEFYLEGGFDYASNCLEPSLPDGLDAEIFSFSTLARTWSEAHLASEREHVTLYITKHPEQFHIGSLRTELDRSHMRWTVDEPEDLEFVRRVFEALYPQNPAFGSKEVLQLLAAKPELTRINAKYRRNEGLERSLRKERSDEIKFTPSAACPREPR